MTFGFFLFSFFWFLKLISILSYLFGSIDFSPFMIWLSETLQTTFFLTTLLMTKTRAMETGHRLLSYRLSLEPPIVQI